ncbi:MAG TPA: hypothetical protein VLB84_08460 [Bacteroidia bacterium]|nr:hypothetical protein [Bacteroidia bacterium]
MPTLDHVTTLSNLKKKGFTEPENKSKDHIRLEFWHEGKLTRAKTKLSHNKQDINDFLISAMSKQICLTKKQFLEFAKCTISQAEYIEILKGQGFV